LSDKKVPGKGGRAGIESKKQNNKKKARRKVVSLSWR